MTDGAGCQAAAVVSGRQPSEQPLYPPRRADGLWALTAPDSAGAFEPRDEACAPLAQWPGHTRCQRAGTTGAPSDGASRLGPVLPAPCQGLCVWVQDLREPGSPCRLRAVPCHAAVLCWCAVHRNGGTPRCRIAHHPPTSRCPAVSLAVQPLVLGADPTSWQAGRLLPSDDSRFAFSPIFSPLATGRKKQFDRFVFRCPAPTPDSTPWVGAPTPGLKPLATGASASSRQRECMPWAGGNTPHPPDLTQLVNSSTVPGSHPM
jgi:hypothetical protein